MDMFGELIRYRIANTKALALLLCALVIGTIVATPAHAVSVSDVNPFIGTAAEGATYPGAAVPFAFATPGPDNCQATTGYCTGQPITGFSQVHVSGTGGAPRYGNLRLMPSLGTPQLLPVAQLPTQMKSVAGEFAATFPDGIRTAMTTTGMTGVTNVRIPQTASQGNISLDVTSLIRHDSRWSQRIVRAQVTQQHNRLTGSITTKGGWGSSAGFTLYFEVQMPQGSLRLHRSTGPVRAKTLKQLGDKGRIGAVLTTTQRSNTVYIAMSMRSNAAAARSLDAAVTKTYTQTRNAAVAKWQAVLGEVPVEGGTAEERQSFATALYHSYLMPADMTNNGPKWASNKPYYDNFYALWDTFRTQDPLLTLLAPNRMRDIANTLLAIHQHDGWMPDARIGSKNGLTQGGSDADIVLADVIAKGLKGIDVSAARRAIIASAYKDSPAPAKFGRELNDYIRLGYLPATRRTSASRTLEYAYNDFAGATVLDAAGDTAGAEKLRTRSRSWEHLWNPATLAIGPKDENNTFIADFDPNAYFFGWPVPFYEGSSRQYSPFVPHDVQGLINRTGGDAGFVAWLDDIMAHHHDPANEPSLLTPWLYIHAGRADRTSQEIRRILATAYTTKDTGLPGNDDAGTMSAWYVFASMGIFPNAGQPYYYLSAPLFSRSQLPVGSNTCTIESPGATSAQPQVLTGVTLNGIRLNRAWITHKELQSCRRLTLSVGPEASGFDNGQRPPSLSLR